MSNRIAVSSRNGDVWIYPPTLSDLFIVCPADVILALTFSAEVPQSELLTAKKNIARMMNLAGYADFTEHDAETAVEAIRIYIADNMQI